MVLLLQKGAIAMATKARKRVHPMPKLGWQDRLLYTVWIAGSVIGILASVWLPLFFRRKIPGGDARILSCVPGDGFGNFLWLFAWLLIFTPLLILVPCKNRIPVFGNAKVRYGPPAYPRVYPLLMKNKPTHRPGTREISKKRVNKIGSVILLAGLVVSLLMYPMCLWGRSELHRSGSVAVYNRFNRQTAAYSPKDVERVRLHVVREGGRQGTTQWEPYMTLCFTDGNSRNFPVEDFGETWSEALQEAQALTVFWSGILHIEDEDQLQKAAITQHMTVEEEEQLYRLFRIPQ